MPDYWEVVSRSHSQLQPWCWGMWLWRLILAHFGQRHVANLVNCDQIEAAPARHHPPQLELMFRFHQLVHQRSRRGESGAPLLPARGHAEAGQKMGLAPESE